MKFRTFIVGLGQIGMGYDYHDNFKETCLTHLNGVLAHDFFELVGAFDPSMERRREFEAKTAVSSFSELKSGLGETKPDFVIIATPTESHYDILKLIVDHCRVKAILCEKPISYSEEEAVSMVNICEEKTIQFFVNYQRRYLASASEIKNKLFPKEKNINFIKGVCWYSKGLIHNGSHFINLLEYWLGSLMHIEIIEDHSYWSDKDMEPDALLSFQKGKVFFLSSRESDFSNYSIELLTSEGKLTYKNGGMDVHWQEKVEDSLFPGYTTLSNRLEKVKDDSIKAQYFVLDQIAKFLLNENVTNVCEASTTLNMIKLLSNKKGVK